MLHFPLLLNRQSLEVHFFAEASPRSTETIVVSNHTTAPIYLYAKGIDTHNQFSSVKANKLIYPSEEKDTF